MVYAHLLLLPPAGDVADDGTSDAPSSARVCARATSQAPQLLQCQLPKGALVGSLVILSTATKIMTNT